MTASIRNPGPNPPTRPPSPDAHAAFHVAATKASSGENPNAEQARVIHRGIDMAVEVPVSYTHLDVYKRQHACSCRISGKPWHGSHFTEERVQESCAHRRSDLSDRHPEALRPPFEVRIMRQRQMGLCHADRQLIKPKPGVAPNLPVSQRQVVYSVSSVDLGCNGLDLFFN